MTADNEAYFLIRINVFEGQWKQRLEYKPKCLDGIRDVEDGCSWIIFKNTFWFLAQSFALLNSHPGFMFSFSKSFSADDMPCFCVYCIVSFRNFNAAGKGLILLCMSSGYRQGFLSALK